jgi:hypothetical protein
MTSVTRLEISRDNWKNKAVTRGEAVRQLRKDKSRLEKIGAESRRHKAEFIAKFEEAALNNAKLREELRQTKNKVIALQSSESTNLTQIKSYALMRSLCVMLVIAGALSFRSIPRALQILLEAKWISPCQVPHFTSVINWTLRSGIAIYNKVTTLNEPWFAIMDCSIDIGIRKALVVLRVPLSTVQRKNGAIGLDDCECIGVKVSTQWNGELVEKELTDIFSKAGNPIAIIKDQGSDLNKGVQLYAEKKQASKIQSINDVGHVAANALKAEFSSMEEFESFLEIVKDGSAKIRQTEMAHLVPPKIRSKGRFQGITKISNWAKKIIELLPKAKSAKKDDPRTKLWNAFQGLLSLKKFLKHFVKTGEIIENFLSLMKKNGLNHKSYLEAKKIIKKLPCKSQVRIRLEEWLENHIKIYDLLGLGSQKMLVSDDVIESLFGYFKTVSQRSPKAELNRLVYVLPLLCGSHTQTQIDQTIRECSHQEMLQHINELPQTLRQKRAQTFGSYRSTVPKTGKSLQSSGP